MRDRWVLLETALEVTEYLINLHHRRMDGGNGRGWEIVRVEEQQQDREIDR